MRRWLPAVVAGVLLLVAGTVYVASLADDGSGHRARMMSSGERGGGPGFQHLGRGMGLHSGRGMGQHMGPGMLARVGSEQEWLVEMVDHHEEAITAAGALERSDRPEMRELGASIVQTQSAQVRRMRRWLAEWYDDRSPRADYRPMMRDLTGLEGNELDRTFLVDMVHHHMAAIMMSQQLLLRGPEEDDDVTRLAGDIRDEQHDEVVTMQAWLRQRFR
jgi:uncharacterized protein (DUF305 family)